MSTEKAIVAKFNWGQDSLVTQSSDLSLKSVADMIKDKAIDISPKYQRRDRWDAEKQAGLIESFLLNIPVPPIYLAETSRGDYSVIDGKQRLTAIYRFIHEGLVLKNLERFTELENYTFDRLPTTLSGPLKIRPYLRVVTLLQQSDPELKHEVFLRLNKSGVRLNSQEIRNVAYRGKFNDMLIEMAENKFFKEQLNITTKSRIYSEMQDVQFVLRAFTVMDIWDSFPSNMDIAMDRFMERNHDMNEAEIASKMELFLGALSFAEAVWGAEAFHREGGTKKALQGFYDIHIVPFMLLSSAKRKHVLGKTIQVREAVKDEIETNANYLEAISQFTSNSERVRLRIGRTTELLKSV